MKKILLHPIYVLAIGLAALNQLLEHNGIFTPFIHCYLDDFLCFPIVLSTGLASYRVAYPWYRLGPWHIWPLFCFIVVFFEMYLPQTSIRYTSDPLDVIFYLLGILVFQKVINTPLS